MEQTQQSINRKWFSPVLEDSSGELFLEFPDDLMETMNWSGGDTLIWEEQPDGSYSLRKADNG